MRLSWIAAAALFSCSPALAQTNENEPNPTELSIGVGTVCNTPDQAKQLADLRSKGTEAKEAVDAVNRKADDPLACGMAAVAFVPAQTIDTKVVQHRLLKIVRINVYAGFDGTNWQPARLTQYAVIEEEQKGETI